MHIFLGILEGDNLPFGMGWFGWFMFPYIANWLGYWFRYYWRFPWTFWWLPPYIPFTPFGVPTIPKEEEVRILEDHARILEQQLNDIRRRIEELKR